MNEESLKQIASITIENSKLISGLIVGLSDFAEQFQHSASDKEAAVALLSQLEDLQLLLESVEPDLAKLQNDLDVS